MKWLDLTHPLTTGMPVYPGDPAVSVRPCCTHPRDGYQVMELHLGSHSGTHLDAPLHFIPGGRSLDQYPVDRFSGQGVVVNVRGMPPGGAIGPEALRPVAPLLPGVEYVLFCTGWDRYFGTPEYEQHPYLTAELARELLARGVRLVGVDSLNPDPTGGSEFPVHEILLGADVLICENLTGLDALLGGPAEFWLLPLKVSGGDGAPIRALGRRI